MSDIAVEESIAALALYGYGNFTSMRVESVQTRGFGHHLERLRRDSLELHDATIDEHLIRQAIRDRVASLTECIARVTIFPSSMNMAHPVDLSALDILVTTRPAPVLGGAPLRLGSREFVRPLPHIKHVGLGPQIYQRRLAQLAGWDDALFVDSAGRIVEGPMWNIGFYDSTHIVWPDSPALPGITMQLIKDALAQHGVPSEVAIVNVDDLPAFSAAFIVNAAIGVRGVSHINNVAFPVNHNLHEMIAERYASVPTEQV